MSQLSGGVLTDISSITSRIDINFPLKMANSDLKGLNNIDNYKINKNNNNNFIDAGLYMVGRNLVQG